MCSRKTRRLRRATITRRLITLVDCYGITALLPLKEALLSLILWIFTYKLVKKETNPIMLDLSLDKNILYDSSSSKWAVFINCFIKRVRHVRLTFWSPAIFCGLALHSLPQAHAWGQKFSFQPINSIFSAVRAERFHCFWSYSAQERSCLLN